MHFGILTEISIILLVGLLFSKLAKILKIPTVTGYLLAGLLVSPFTTGVISIGILANLSIFLNITLGFIAFSIGSEFKIGYFKKVGFTPIVIAVLEGTFAAFAVTIVLYLFGFSLPFSLMLGAIAAATAPASTIMVIKQYKAKGETTRTLLSVVALDDAVALICFGFALAATKAIQGSSTNLLVSIFTPILEIIISIVFGILLGMIFIFALQFFKSKGNRFSLLVAFVLLGVEVSPIIHASPLLVCMTLGGTMCNLYSESNSIMDIVDYISPPLYIVFFVLSGAALDYHILPSLGLAGTIYVIFRVVGKVGGAMFGGKIMKANKNVTKYLGLALLPQEGVAIGLSLIAQQVVPEDGNLIRAIILCSTLIFVLSGPVISRFALTKAGDIKG